MTAPQIAGRSDALVIGLVSLAHLLSHFYQVILGPLFPLLKVEFGVSYTALGCIISLFYGVSGVCQAFVGILVDRWGGDRLMLFGIVAMASAVLLMSFALASWVFLPLAVLAALGNCVFHPADLSILFAKVDPNRLGRAFGLHGFGGTCGYFLSHRLSWWAWLASRAGGQVWRLPPSSVSPQRCLSIITVTHSRCRVRPRLKSAKTETKQISLSIKD